MPSNLPVMKGKSKAVLRYTIVDDDILPLLQQHRWVAGGEYYYSLTKERPSKRILLHHFVWEHHHGPGSIPRGKAIDHYNKDPHDNQIKNLMLADDRIRKANERLRSDNKTGFRCVSEIKKTGRYAAQVTRGRKQYRLGVYDDPIQAAHAVNIAYSVLHPEASRHNTIPPGSLGDRNAAIIEAKVREILDQEYEGPTDH